MHPLRTSNSVLPCSKAETKRKNSSRTIYKVLSTELGANRTAEINAQAGDWRAHHHTVLEFVYKQGENETGFPAYALAAPENGGHTAMLLPSRQESMWPMPSDEASGYMDST